MDYNEQLKQVMNDPHEMARRAGFNIPAEIRDPQEMVRHLIQTGQIRNPLLQRIMPLMRGMGK